jgi:hypothetical protein
MMQRIKLPSVCGLITTIFFINIICTANLFAQMLAGAGAGSTGGKEVKASPLEVGGVSGDVNLFNGTIASSYSLGTVTTIGIGLYANAVV